MEQNELNKNAMGGTELMMKWLYEHVDNDLLDKFQIIPSRVRDIDPNRKTILWVHDLATDPEVQHLRDGGWKAYDKIVFVSHWQQEMYNVVLGVPYSAGVVLLNAIRPIDRVRDKPNDGKLKLIYTSTPHRGLELLYYAFDELAKQYSNIELDVYSSFALYGWEERDKPYQELFEKLGEHEQINYYGAKDNDTVRKALIDAHIFAYPSIWQETSCICLMEAMSAGCTCIHSSYGALPETSMGITKMYGYTDNIQHHLNTFYTMLKQYINLYEKEQNRELFESNNRIQKQLVDTLYGWEGRKQQWTNLLQSLV